MKKRLIVLLIILISICMITKAQNLERKNVDQKYKWNLSDLYKSQDEWLRAKESIQKNIGDITQYKGKLAESPETFYKGIKTYFDLLKEFYRLSDYASRLSDENLNDSKNQSLVQQATALGTEISVQTAFLSPEILKMDKSKVDGFFNAKKELADYRMFVNDIFRQKEHTLSEPEEQILASFGLSGDTPSNVYSIFTNAEMPYAKVKLSTGEEVELSPALFTKYRAVQNRQDRENVFSSFFNNYKRFQNTLGANLSGKVKTDYIYAKDRKFNNALEASLSGPNIPVSVYENLIAQIHNSLPTLHRFLDLKKRMLKVDTLHYYDLYAPIVKQTSMHFNVEDGQKIIMEALQPLGSEYNTTLQKAFGSRWIDFMPTVGKRSGAYSSGAAYDVHP
ncbi:MAG: M3 family metallopeptidase, partial [Bacillota bacterium]